VKRTAGKKTKGPSRDGKNRQEDEPASKEVLEASSMTERRVAADLPLFLTGLLLFSYVAYRAVHLSFTHDESLTYIYGIRPGLASILAYSFNDANNHFLNTLLGHLSSILFGVTELSLRLPNVIAGLLYLTGAGFIARMFKPWPVRLGSFLVLTVNPFLLDFFSLSRGYGLAAGFQMLSLLFLLLFIEKKGEETRYLLASTWSAFFSVLSNLTFLNYYLALVAVLPCIFFLFWKKSAGKKMKPCFGGRLGTLFLHQIVQTGLLFLISVPMILKLKARGALYFGGDTGFWVDTVQSLIGASLYGVPHWKWVETAMGIMVVAVFLGGAVACFFRAGKKRSSDILAPCAVLSIALLCVLSTESQYWLFGNRFLMERTALLFLPLFALQFVLLFRLWMSNSFRLPVWMMAGLCGLLVCHALMSFNVSHTYTWHYDADTRKMIEDLVEYRNHGEKPLESVTLCARWIYEPSVNFYRLTYDLSWLNRMTRRKLPASDCDFIYVDEKSVDKVILPVARVNAYHETGMVLLAAHREKKTEME